MPVVVLCTTYLFGRVVSKRSSRRGAATGLVFGIVAFAASAAVAAGLSVMAQQDSAGVAGISACDQTVTAALGRPSYNGSEYVASSVEVTDVDVRECNGQTVLVTVTDENGVALADGQAVVRGRNTTVSLSSAVSVSASARVAVMIYAPADTDH